jgi:O-antigen/teichoic acid export membrane protein
VIGVTFATGLIVARSVGPAGNGALTVLGALVTLASVVTGFGLATGGVHLYRTNDYSIGTITGVSVLLWTVALALYAVVISIGGDAVLRLLPTPSAKSVLEPEWLALSFAILPALLLSSLIQSIWLVDNHMRLYAALNIASQLLGFALACVLVAALHWGVTGALLSNLGAQYFTLIMSIAWLRSLGEPVRFRSLTTAFRPVIRASYSAYVNSIVANIFKHGEAILLVVLLNLSEVGHYGVALAFYHLLTEAPRAFVWPLVGRMTDGDANPAELAAKSLRVIPIALLLPLAAMASVSPYLIRFFYGGAFESAGTLLAFMAPGVFFRSIHLVVYSYLVVVGRLDKIVLCVGIAAAANLLLDLLFVPAWGLRGVALSNVMSELILAVLSVIVFLTTTRIRLASVFVSRSDVEDLSRQVGRMVTTWRS